MFLKPENAGRSGRIDSCSVSLRSFEFLGIFSPMLLPPAVNPLPERKPPAVPLPVVPPSVPCPVEDPA